MCSLPHSVAGSPPRTMRPVSRHSPGRRLKRHMRVLLDQQHRRSAFLNFRDDLKHRLHDDRRESQHGSSSSSRRGLAISPRATATICCCPPDSVQPSAPAKAESPEELEHRLGLAPDRWLERAIRSAEHDVFAHGKAGKNPPPFGHMGDAQLDDRARAQTRDRLAVEQDRPERGARGRRSRATWSISRRRWRRAASRLRLIRSRRKRRAAPRFRRSGRQVDDSSSAITCSKIGGDDIGLAQHSPHAVGDALAEIEHGRCRATPATSVMS